MCWCYAALDASLVATAAGSGAGPQTYALNNGVGSTREPREMTIPTGSSLVMVYDFFIVRILIDERA